MATRAELPLGFGWQEVPQMRAAFPKPGGWSYRYEDAPGTQACFITKESFFPGVFLPTTEEIEAGQGFKTGLSVNSFPGVTRRTGRLAVELARSFFQTSLLTPIDQLEVLQDPPLVIYRRQFRSEAEVAGIRGATPTRYYVEMTANPRTDRTYMIMFETPAELWQQYRDAAEVMVKNRVLNPDF